MITVERAQQQDASQFASLEQLAENKSYVMPNPLEVHVRQMSEPALVYLRILNGSQVVGFFLLALDEDGTSVEFRRIVVAVKGQGIGQQGIAAMETFCRKELGRQRIWLDVFSDNHRARHIYEKLGYEQFDESVYQGKPLYLLQKAL